MWRVVASALAARRGQTIIVGLVALLACAAVTAAPWYAVSATQQVGVAAVAGAPVEERLISVSWWVGPDDQAPEHPVGEVRKQFSPAGFTSVAGGSASADLQNPDTGRSAEVALAYRQDMCDHLVVKGSCPHAAGEVILPGPLADRLALGVGDTLAVTQDEDRLGTARVVGVYRVGDPSDPYWGDGSLVGLGSPDTEPPVAFTVLKALPSYGQVTYTDDLLANPGAFATTDARALHRQLEAELSELRTQGYTSTTGEVPSLLDRIARDRQNVTAGVVVGVAVLLLLTWFTLAVVLRAAVVQVRGDVGWWRLHGGPPGRGWLLVLGQGAVPLVIGALLGAAAGLGLGQVLAGTLAAGAGRTALAISLALVVLTVAGGFVAVVAAQFGTVRTPVRELLRRVPARRGRWRRSLIDLILVVVAAAAVGQALAVGDVEGLALFAPWLAGLALALIAAWAIPPLASWLAARALHAGRLAIALVAASMARRPGTNRLFALAAVAVALLTTAFVTWDTGTSTQWQRAALETGADRVITVAPVDTARLLAAVRDADPTGTEAMAVVRRPGIAGDPPVLAVDSTRLGVIAGWRTEYGGDTGQVAAALRPSEPRPATIHAGSLALKASGTAGPAGPAGTAVRLRVRLRTLDSGRAVDAVTARLADRPDSYRLRVPACAAGCRLVGVQLLGAEKAGAPGTEAASADTANGDSGGTASGETAPGYARASSGAQVKIYGLTGAGSGTGAGGKATGGGLLGDAARWRPALGPRDLGPAISADGGALRLTVRHPPEDVQLERNDWAYVVDTPVPLPVLTAGWRPDPSGEMRVAPLSGAAVPTEVARTASLIPSLGKTGVLVDLAYADRLVPFPLAGDTSQVWLSASAPPSLVDDLESAGLTPLREDSLSDHLERLGDAGHPVGVRFDVVVTLVGLLLAAGAVLVHAAQERASRASELAALRAQGVRTGVIRLVGYAGMAAVLGAATVVGLVAGLVGAAIARVLDPGFVDGWRVLPTAPITALPVGYAAAVAVLVLGAAVVATAVLLVRRIQDPE